MRLWSLSVFAFSAVVSSQLVALHRGARGFVAPQNQPGPKPDRNQRPMVGSSGPGPVDPSSLSMSSAAYAPAPGATDAVMLSDVMGRDRSINIFAGFTRDIESVCLRLEDSSKRSVVLAPLNSAIEKLPKKPWENPDEYDALGANAYEREDGYERAQRNLRRFVEAHIVPIYPWAEGERVKPIGHDREVWWEDRGGTKVLQPDNLEVLSVAGTVANGQLWIIKGVRNY